ncbi:MAG: hypothetical protein HQL25_01180 [Candidatus Omnitrophica bacterium]|nr:hypothetical protein [Candidatus Omnitrophota bacterium]
MRKIFLLFLVFGLMGCSSTARLYEPMRMGTNSDNTGLVFDCSRFLGQTEVIGHRIIVDEQEFTVDAMSVIRVMVKPGWHTVKITSIGEDVKKDDVGDDKKIASRSLYDYGRPIKLKMMLKEGNMKRIEYKSPFWTNMIGQVEVKAF